MVAQVSRRATSLPIGMVATLQYPILVALLVLAPILFALIVPPSDVPDENGHFAKAVQLAYWTFPTVHDRAGQNFAIAPQDLAQVISDWPPAYPQTRRRSVADLLKVLVKPPSPGDETGMISLSNLASYPPVFYLPQAVGLRFGRALGLSAAGQFYAGRFTAAVISVTLILCAVSAMPFGQRTMLIIATLPAVSQQLGSYSADAMMFSVSFITVAVLLRGGRLASFGSLWALPVLLPMIVLAKGVYLPICLAGLGGRGAWRPCRLAWTFLWISIGALLFAIWFGVLANGDINVQHYISRRTLQHVSAAPPHAQLLFLLSHPMLAVSIILGSAIERAPILVVECIGRFGWLNVAMPLPAYGLGLIIMLACTFAPKTDPVLPTAGQRAIWFGITVVVVLLVHIALYLTATAYGESYVEGVQGRYFVPVLPLLVLSLRMRLPAWAERWIDMGLPWAAVTLSACGLVTVLAAFWKF